MAVDAFPNISRCMEEMATIQGSLLDAVWPEGRNPGSPWDGTHYILRGFARPVSISTVESYFVANLIFLSPVQRIIEIGTGFGYSSNWFVLGLSSARRPGEVITVDNYSEGGLGQHGLDAAREMAGRLNLSSFIRFTTGTSPDDIPIILAGRAVDVAFIDANHHADHPLMDYEAILPHVNEAGIILFHDVDPSRYTVPAAIRRAREDGWVTRDLNTSCHLTVAYRTNLWPRLIKHALDEARTRSLMKLEEN